MSHRVKKTLDILDKEANQALAYHNAFKHKRNASINLMGDRSNSRDISPNGHPLMSNQNKDDIAGGARNSLKEVLEDLDKEMKEIKLRRDSGDPRGSQYQITERNDPRFKKINS